VALPENLDRAIRVVSFGSDHCFTDPALQLLGSLEGFVHVGHIRTFDERQFLRDPNSERSLAFLAALEPDLFVSSGYGRILRAPALRLATIGGVNVHPSLLPRFRGRNTVGWALYEGVPEIGVTIHEMTLPVDSGPILAQERLRVGRNDGQGDLYRRLAARVPLLLGEVLAEIRRTRRIVGTPQPEGGSYRKFAGEEAGRLEFDWSQTAAELERRAKVFPDHCNVRVGRWRIYFRRIERISTRRGAIVRRRFSSIDVVAGDAEALRLHLKRPIRAWAKLVLSRHARHVGTSDTEQRTMLDDLTAQAALRADKTRFDRDARG
jgi:methionyl-tRNA formyltransferase